MYFDPNGRFFRRLDFGPYKYAASSIFLHALQIDQGVLAHIPRGTGVPTRNFNRENLKFGLKFSVLESITSGLVGVSSWNFTVHVPRGRGNNVGRIFGTPPPQKKWGVQKNRPKFDTISDNFPTLWWPIFPERVNISKIAKVHDHLQPLPRWTKKVGVLWSTSVKVIDSNVFRP